MQQRKRNSKTVGALQLANKLIEYRRLDGAVRVLEEAYANDPTFPPLIRKYAYVLERASRLDDALQVLENGLKVAPDDPHLLIVWVKILKREGHLDQAVVFLKGLLERDLPNPLRCDGLYLLGSCYDALGLYSHAFASFSSANEMSENEALAQGFDKTNFLKDCKKSQAVLNEMSQPQVTVPHPPDPVFLLGFPRSGTTLLDQVLDSHPQIQTVEESPSVYRMKAALGPAQDANAIENEVDPSFLDNARTVYYETIEHFVKRQNNQLLIDKLPLHVTNLPWIVKVFPGSRFIFARRHPLDVCLSCWMQNFKQNNAMANFNTLGDTVYLYTLVMDLWDDCVSTLNIKFHLVQYERLVYDFEPEVRSLLAFLGLRWDAAVLNFYHHASARKALATPSYSQVTKPIYKRALYRWRNYRTHLAPFIHILEPYIHKFGYSLD